MWQWWLTTPVRSDPMTNSIRIESFSCLLRGGVPAHGATHGALVGRRDVAEELVQDAFVTLHGRWDRVSRYESPEGWLRRVVINRSMSALRRRAVEVRLLGRLSRLRERPAGIRPTAKTRSGGRSPHFRSDRRKSSR